MSKVQVDTIDTRSGTSTMQIGSTNTSTINIGVSGDTVNIPAGVTIANSGTATGFGETNTPSIKAVRGSAQAIANTTSTVVIFDTGIRNGEDIIKAKCLGADFVMIGKPALFSLGAEGMLGLIQMVNNLAKEIEIGMSQMGVADFNMLNRNFIYNQ